VGAVSATGVEVAGGLIRGRAANGVEYSCQEYLATFRRKLGGGLFFVYHDTDVLPIALTIILATGYVAKLR
jgi:hypothetical protein